MYDLEQMKGLVAKGKVSRRDFIQFALASGVTLAAAQAMFVTAARAEPQYGGHLRMGLAHGSATDSLDPIYYPDTFTQVGFWGILSNSLTMVDSKGELIPDLAGEIEPSDGAKTWAFRLRPGLTFHNGKDVVADDVLASFAHHMSEESESPMKSVLSAVSDIKADGPDLVIFTLNEGNADFPYLVSDYKVPIMPAREDGKVDWESGIRTGAFSLESFEPGVNAKFVKNPNYHWDGRPYVDSCEILALPDVTTRTNALTTGEIDWMARCDLKTLSLLERDSNLVINEVTGYGHYTLPMLGDVAPFDDPNVRLAIMYAIDRDEIVQKIFLGHATPGNDNPIPPPPSIKFAVDPEPRHSYDPEKAKWHLEQAGLTSLQVDLSVSDAAFDGAVDCAVLIKESAAKCGIDVNVIREPADGYWSNVWGVKGWSASYWSGRPTCDWMFSTAYAGNSSWNETHFKNARFDELLVLARAELDQDKRAEMYAEMQQLIHDDSGEVVLVFNSFVSANRVGLAHDEIAGNWEVDGLRLAERWWFAEPQA
jgi:peptide/nickel transport system substrate-binding protein